jgi:hypothetical protein
MEDWKYLKLSLVHGDILKFLIQMKEIPLVGK